jgi:hypothetical protein
LLSFISSLSILPVLFFKDQLKLKLCPLFKGVI